MKKKLISIAVALLTLVALMGIALAQGDATPEENRNALTQLIDLLFKVLMVVVPPVVLWLVHRAVSFGEKKAGIDIPDSIERKVDDWIELGIHYAAEKSRQKVKEKTAKLTGPEKLETAADFVFDMVKAQGWDDWTIDKIKKKINAAVGIHRANGGMPKLEPADKQ